MKKTSLKKRIISAIALVITIAIGFSACEFNLGSPNTTPAATTPVAAPENTTPSNTPTTPQVTTPSTPDGPIEPPVHVCVFSDWVTVKNATTTEDGLRERRCECGKVEQEIIEASNTEYYVEYRNLKSAAYPSETGYNSKDGLLHLPQPEAVGYEFVGWYTASIGGDLIDYIPEGSKKNYILYAHWELVSYEITYKNVPNNTNVTTYNIEDKVKLETPKWSGLVFTHWSDNNGNTYLPEENITFLPEKMYGDLTLTANWKVLRNIATPAPADAELKNVFSSGNGFLCFYYDLGTIEHVVLDSIHPDMYYKYEGMPLNLTLSKTVSISEERAESTAKTISKSVSNTLSFSTASNWATENSLSQKAEVSSSIGVDGFVSASIEATYGVDATDTTSYGRTTAKDTSSSSSTGSSNTVSSSLAYKKELTSEITENISVDADLPSGYYAYVHAGNIRVIAMVFYEIKTGNYYLNTYSILDNMHSMMMYYADVNQLNNPTVDGLDFTIPKEEILNFVENSYYVTYDANGGTGTMPTTLHSVNGNEKLATNSFVRSGYEFTGWELKTNSGVKILLDGQSVSNLGKAHEIVTLKALWTSTEPVWVVKETGTNYYIKPAKMMGFDTSNALFQKYNNEKMESTVDGNTKVVVTEEKFHTYVYWHWATNNYTTGDILIGDYKNEVLNGKKATYFMAFESTKNYGKTDPNGTTDSKCYAVNHSKTDGSWWWHRVEVYVQTYTVYENVNPIN